MLLQLGMFCDKNIYISIIPSFQKQQSFGESKTMVCLSHTFLFIKCTENIFMKDQCHVTFHV